VAKDNGDLLQMEGIVEEVLPNAMFRVKLNNEQSSVITAVISGRMRQNRIQILEGDKVKVEMSVYDLTRGRVVYRER
jgi:translation initiation factor IF-1